MRDQYNEQLKDLDGRLSQMGSLCEECISRVALALAGQEQGSAPEETEKLLRRVYQSDAAIDRMEREIEALCYKLLLKQQPVASDLRFVSAALKMISDMERIGDQCADIADITRFLTDEKAFSLESSVHIRDMATGTMHMVTRAVDSFVRRDLSQAREVIASDDDVDGLFDEVRTEIAGLIARYPERGMVLLDLLMIAKYFERLGDHATNVAEWVEFAVTGEHSKKNKYENQD